MFAVDDSGAGLRASWRPAHGFVNLSLWRGDRCIDTFHLDPAQSAELVGFLAGALASEAPAPERVIG